MEHSRQRATFQLQAKAACGSGLVYKVSKLTDNRAANLRGWMGCLSESLRAAGSAIQKMGRSLVTWSPLSQLCTLQTKWLPMSLWVGLAGDYCSSVSFDSVSFWLVWRFCSNLFSQPDSGDWEKHGCWWERDSSGRLSYQGWTLAVSGGWRRLQFWTVVAWPGMTTG